LHSHIKLTASSYMTKNLRISSYIRKPYVICDFATAPFWISLNMKKKIIYFLLVQKQHTRYAFLLFFSQKEERGNVASHGNYDVC